MSSFCYAVIATLPDAATAAEYVAWLKDGHVDQVVAGGATSASIVPLDPDTADAAPRVMTQYVFPSRAVFNTYVERYAPALRADGQKRFPPARGVTFVRLAGECV